MTLLVRVTLLLLGLFATGCRESPPASPQGDFATLARTGEGYEQARVGVELTFPRDHGPHPGFRIEWWYLTANLSGPDGRPYGVQWTLFRMASQPPGGPRMANPWNDSQWFMAHFAVTTADDHVAFQRYARGGEHGGIAQAGAQPEPFMAWLDDWSLQSSGPGWLPLELQAGQEGFAARLRLDSEQPWVLQGEDGFSQKHPLGGGSHYYSHPFLQVTGDLLVDGQAVEVTGQAWLDREWSSQFLQPDQVGWDWFAVHLDSGEKLMLFRLRPAEAGGPDYLHGALFSPRGERLDLDPRQIELSPIESVRIAGRDLPLRWRVSLPEAGRTMELRALHPDQWMDVDFAYWEGVIVAEGDGPGSRGRGYLELTGYPPTD